MNISLVSAARRSTRFVLAATVVLLPLRAALAANPDIVVTKFTDSLDGSCNSDCSLREAVQLANQTAGASRIILAAGTYTLSIAPQQDPDRDDPLVDDDNNVDGDLDIKGTLTIVGKGIDVTVIDAGRIDRIAEVLPGAVATLSKLTVRNGRQPSRGGGLDVNAGGTLSLKSCGVSNNLSSAAFEPGSGGGIWNEGTLNIDASRIDGNRSSAGEGRFGAGGGIYNKGSLTVRDALFVGNSATDDDDTGLGGAIYNSGTADIRRAAFERNGVSVSGSGASILNAGHGQLRLENSTVTSSSNNEPFGITGAVENGDRYDGPTGSVRLVNVTIAGNEIYGLVNRGRIVISNSIIAGNGVPLDSDSGYAPSSTNCLNVGAGAQFSQVGLLRGTDPGNCPTTLLVLNTDTFVTELYPLAPNGWQSPTFALRPGSIAIDAAVGACPSVDQRRVVRPQDSDGNGTASCDIGAFEATP
ncbi:MAG: CSLREA domain-containing protein [Gammaproteobacteria bacterium]|uniref:choice-of-anchor Q domain-containing protein n=1 Tax=Nevskia sp. TaxID=1929292 RepID=UPI0040363658|nr:CSLREA domain-containing protein [Gammaproteobacteria bacterium]